MSDQQAGTSHFPTVDEIEERVESLVSCGRPRYQRLWAYYRNPMRVIGSAAGAQDRPYRQAQEWGLPYRITGARAGAAITPVDNDFHAAARKEVVIENDIGWRIETIVDYLFGKPLVLRSAAVDPARREVIGELLRQILAASGGILFLQQLALLGSVYGFVDVLVKFDADAASAFEPVTCGTQDLGQPPATPSKRSDGGEGEGGGGTAAGEAGTAPRDAAAAAADESSSGAQDGSSSTPRHLDSTSGSARAVSHPSPQAIARLARMVRLEIVEPARALPFLDQENYRCLLAYGQCFEIGCAAPRGEGANPRRTWLDLLKRITSRSSLKSSDSERTFVVEIITPAAWQRYENAKVVAAGENSLGRVPVVHIQNTAVPFAYSGDSDVEPLIPLQDELNTRLSDRANRITLQSFKMYLGKGIEGFDTMPVAPGRMWMTENTNADVIPFGGDSSSPSEDAHLSDVREAIDKSSGVTPIAAGAIKGRIGRLTSAAALRVTLQALLAKTEKKRTTYGNAIGQICELGLAWLDRAGVFRTTAEERQIELNWPSPLPENELEKLTEAQAKAQLGVPKDVLLKELGY